MNGGSKILGISLIFFVLFFWGEQTNSENDWRYRQLDSRKQVHIYRYERYETHSQENIEEIWRTHDIEIELSNSMLRKNIYLHIVALYTLWGYIDLLLEWGVLSSYFDLWRYCSHASGRQKQGREYRKIAHEIRDAEISEYWVPSHWTDTVDQIHQDDRKNLFS